MSTFKNKFKWLMLLLLLGMLMGCNMPTKQNPAVIPTMAPPTLAPTVQVTATPDQPVLEPTEVFAGGSNLVSYTVANASDPAPADVVRYMQNDSFPKPRFRPVTGLHPILESDVTCAAGNLVDVSASGIVVAQDILDAAGTQKVSPKVMEDLTEMVTAAKAAGIQPGVRSTCRSVEWQKGITPNPGVANALISYHQLPYAFDFTDGSIGYSLDTAEKPFAQTPFYQFLMSHGYEYGFIPLYNQNTPEAICKTGHFTTVPWYHIGKDAAAEYFQLYQQFGITSADYFYYRQGWTVQKTCTNLGVTVVIGSWGQ